MKIVPVLDGFVSSLNLSDRVYDILKWIALMLLPSATALYVALGSIWGYVVNPDILALATFVGTVLGLVIGISATNYYEKVPNLEKTFGVKIYRDMLWITLYLLPASATVYYLFSVLVKVPYPNEIVQTIISLNVFLGLVLGIGSQQNSDLVSYMKNRIAFLFSETKEHNKLE